MRDIKAIPDYDATFTNASLKISAEVRNLTTKAAKGYTIDYKLYENRLYSDENTLVPNIGATATVGEVGKNGRLTADVTLNAGNIVKPWSAEAPHRYTLVGQLKDKKGNVVETFSTIVGFRKIEIKDTPADKDEFGLAGRYYYLNGQPIKMKGVNRHENNPATGHYVSREQMQHEVFLMKRGNINHVRNCHYPDAPYWYYLCDKYGIYLEDEANIESHEYYYGKESLSHVKEFRNAHVARNMEMVHATVNSPSVVIWSLGNEAGPGDNFKDCYAAIKAYDTSRPVQYERNNNIVDMGSNQYPSIPWVQEAVKGKYDIKYPYHISEYAHSMGNAVGNLVDYWNAIESTNFFMGGAIWDWVDQAIYNIDPKTGKRYWGYGGDFGMDNKPNDGMFCMNGIMRPDLSPKAQYFEVKKVYQNVGVKAIDMTKGRIEIFNKNYFEPLRGYQIVWSLWKDGECIESNKSLMGAKNIVGPRERQEYTLDYDFAKLDAKSEYFVKIQFLQGKDMPWAEKGYAQMEEQLLVKEATVKHEPLTTAAADDSNIYYTQDAKSIKVKGNNFNATFDLKTGAIESLSYAGNTVFADGNGPKLDAFPVLFGNKDKILAVAKEQGVTLGDNVEFVDPDAVRQNYVDRLVELRKAKGMTPEAALEMLKDNVALATMMIERNELDGLVSGAVHTTANTIRPPLQIIKTAPGAKLVSAIFFMLMPEQVYVYGDCALNINPDAEQLSEIAIQSADTAKAFGIDPKVAMVTYSTMNSGKGTDVDLMKAATELVRQKRPDIAVDGPLQYDAAVMPNVAAQKAPNSPVAGKATVFIFPSLSTGNTVYKAVQRSAGLVSIGPMLQGMKKPVNDLSRGALVDDIIYTIAVTAIQAAQIK